MACNIVTTLRIGLDDVEVAPDRGATAASKATATSRATAMAAG
eukprot:CAMPEP_0183578504 /NCGR_PEP_ID=MMETSP0371-20130417/141958_1 /TAXON_ID=268820 /ORGANISM="Peridinium aciculiferum, Strain PAER-2" /LENGTH=42 /DNA_ID= /DNA_START= /DNA_END= /DNA_ORIENTATION=